jgi:hypothetical protein
MALNVIGAIFAAWLYFNQEEHTFPHNTEYTYSEVINENERLVSSNDARPDSVSSAITPTASGVELTDEEFPPVASPPQNPSEETKAVVEEKGQPEEDLKPDPVHTAVYTHPGGEKDLGAYTVTKPKVYFHDEPDEKTRRGAFINHWNKAVLKPLDEVNGFVYVVYTNHWGQTSKGWMLKKELTPLNK